MFETQTPHISCDALAPPPLAVVVLGLAMLSGVGCDSSVEPVVQESDPIPTERGPARSAFPADRMMTTEEAEQIVTGNALARTTSGDPLVLVPLVFDDDGYLHSARSFNAYVDSVMRARPSELEGNARTANADDDDPTILFTDYKTFMDVVNGSGTRRATSYASLYAAGTFARIQTRSAVGNARSGSDPFTDVFDPYTCDERTVIECPADPLSDRGPGQWRGSNVPSRTPTIQWPELIPGDIISGDMEGGNPGALGWGDGHTSLVTTVRGTGPIGGGFIEDRETRVMEARMYGILFVIVEALTGLPVGPDEEVEERSAWDYWVQNQDVKNGPSREGVDVMVRYHKTASQLDFGPLR